MPDKKLKPFVLNDESVVNTYNFRVRNAGLDFSDFDTNPVMLDSHINETEYVVGNWQNRRFEGSKLLADANFDVDTDRGKKLSGQVDRGFVKGASLGIFIDFDENTWERQPDGSWDLLKAVVKEATVCGIPSNAGALALFLRATGQEITEDQFKLSLKNLSVSEFITPNTPTMEKIILTPGALSAMLAAGSPNADNAGEISRGIEKLQADLTAEKATSVDLKAKLDKQIKLQAEALADSAVADEKITAGTERDELVELAMANYTLAARHVKSLKGKASLSHSLSNSADGEVKSIDDFEKLSDEKKLAFKASHPDAYKKLFASA